MLIRLFSKSLPQCALAWAGSHVTKYYKALAGVKYTKYRAHAKQKRGCLSNPMLLLDSQMSGTNVDGQF